MKSQHIIHLEDPAMPDSAEGWVARLASPDVTGAQIAAFEAWCEANPDNRNDYVRVERLHTRVRELSRDALIGAAARAARRDGAAGRPRRLRPLAWAAAAASIALVALTATVQWRAEPAQRYDTRVGERREILLDDGTRAVLDTNSAIAVRYGADRRALTVERGRVEIDVAAQPGRPFVTYAANSTINDIGTRFQVAHAADHVLVTLLEGEVSIATPESGAAPTVLKPGAQARVDARGGIAASAADLDAANGWTRGELVFKNRALADLVAEMNRYAIAQIRLGDRALDGIAVSGVFHAGDQDALIKALESGWSLRADRVSDREIVLRAPPRR
jgi:transmembrane sensor